MIAVCSNRLTTIMAGLLSGYSSGDSSADEAPVVKAKPPPRKVQIKLDALPVEEPAPAPKPIAKPSGSKHSLFGMLPPPKRKDSEVRAEREQLAQQRKVAQHSDEEDVGSAPLELVEEPEQGKAKTNDAFRAMLGLKPSQTAPVQQPTAAAAPSISNAETTVKANPNAPAAPSIPNVETTAKAKPKASFQISAAPDVTPVAEPPAKEEEDTYPGWQLDPDGSWVPVTPEAQAQYQTYLASTAPAPTQKRKREHDNLDGTRDLLSAGINPDDIQSFDVSSATRAAYDTNADAQDTDKYAAAAEFAAGNREATAPKAGHLRGLRRGQLSTLVNLAAENRSSLEQKWQRGREARSRAGNQYGF